MNYDLALTPVGHLRLRQGSDDSKVAPDTWMKRIVSAFSLSQAKGLFALAATRPSAPPPPAFSFWRDFACCYLTQLCCTPEFVDKLLDPIEPPVESKLAAMLLNAPPMQGAEYLSVEVLRELWADLDTITRTEIAESKNDLSGWLKLNASTWHQVGRVCFHLAENKQDPELPFAFLATYALSLSKSGRVQYQPLGKALQEYAGQRNKKALINLLSPVQRASEKVDFIKEMIDSGDIFHPLAWTPREAYRLLKNVSLLEESGLLVRLPNWWRKRPRPRVAVTIGEKKQSRFGTDAILDFKIGVALEDQNLTEAEWRRIMASEDGLIYIKGHWIEVNRQKLGEALAHWKQIEANIAGQGISFIEGMRLLAGASTDLNTDTLVADKHRKWCFVDAGKWLSDILSDLRDPGKLTLTECNKDFRGTLRSYQKTGANWLWLLSNLGLGACLADDMGLGKTIQILSLLLALKQGSQRCKPSLLVLPASLLANWKAEIKRFAPTLEIVFIHPSETDQATLVALTARPSEILAGVDLVLTTYAMLSRHKWLLDITWQLVILDEAQAIKNPAAKQTQIVKQLKADARIALTGTPVENQLSDLWSLFDFLCPGLLGSAAKFKKFVKGLEAREHDRYAPLRNLINPYVLRRLKTDKRIIADLPDKTEMKVFCGLTKKQTALYTKSVQDLALTLEGLDGIKRRGFILAFLMRFKQICNHPSQFLDDGEYEPTDSGKFKRLRTICEEIASRQQKVLVFTQFSEMTESIAAFLTGLFGQEGLTLHGRTPIKKRQSLIDRFQEEDGPPFFVLSLKAGGTGLNLTAASHVVHFDRWWNPAVENQATDRVFRIGQHSNVVVHKFVCRGTIEEKIDALIEEKTNLADDILKAGAESMLTEMSNAQLLKVVALDIDRAQM